MAAAPDVETPPRDLASIVWTAAPASARKDNPRTKVTSENKNLLLFITHSKEGLI
jgi:hypothetical protein